MAAGVERLVTEARSRLRRVTPAEIAADDEPDVLLVDIRPLLQRRRQGEIPGAMIIGRNVLEWRLDPTGPNRLPEADDPGRTVVVFCSAGHASSLAAKSLQELGWPRATDLIGGFEAWAAAGLPVQPCPGPTPEEDGASAPGEIADQRGEL